MKNKTTLFELTVEDKSVLASRIVEFRHATRSERRLIALAVAKQLSGLDAEPRIQARYLTVSKPSGSRA